MERIALITGGMGGIGSSIAKAASAEGYTVLLTYHAAAKESVDSFLASLPGSGHQAYQVDLHDRATIHEILATIRAEFSRLDLVVHTAAEHIVRSTIEAMPEEAFAEQFDVAVFGAFELFKGVIPLMKENGGLIVGITTSFIEPGHTTARMSGYISAKYALQGLLRELATETKPYNIRVNAVAPDLLQTAFSGDLPARYFEWAAERDPRGRLTTPEEVAEKILFLASPEGAVHTGLSFPVASGEPHPL